MTFSTLKGHILSDYENAEGSTRARERGGEGERSKGEECQMFGPVASLIYVPKYFGYFHFIGNCI